MVHCSQPGLLVGHVELGQSTYPSIVRIGTLNCNGKTPLLRVNVSNQMMTGHV